MKAVRIHHYGDEEVLSYEEAPLQALGPRDVLIRVAAASVNRGDLFRRQGNHRNGVPVSLPLVLGSDVAGVVEGMGANVWPEEAREGQKVLALLNGGGYAEYVITHVAATQPVPQSVSLEDAAGIPVAFLTAWFGLLLPDHGALQGGQTCLVTAAGSGVGVAAIQIAKHLGAWVIASAGSDWKLERAKALGADALINYATEDLAEAVQGLTDDQGVDVVLELVGGWVYEQSLEAVAAGGRMVILGRSSGEAPRADEGELVRNGVQVSTFGLPSQIPGGNARRALGELLALFQDQYLQPVVDRVFPLRDAPDAHRYLAARKNFGKVLLKP